MLCANPPGTTHSGFQRLPQWRKATVKGWGLAHAGPGHAPSQPGNLVNSGGCPNSLYFVSASHDRNRPVFGLSNLRTRTAPSEIYRKSPPNASHDRSSGVFAACRINAALPNDANHAVAESSLNTRVEGIGNMAIALIISYPILCTVMCVIIGLSAKGN
jgi:hypothetical protein